MRYILILLIAIIIKNAGFCQIEKEDRKRDLNINLLPIVACNLDFTSFNNNGMLVLLNRYSFSGGFQLLEKLIISPQSSIEVSGLSKGSYRVEIRHNEITLLNQQIIKL